MNNKSIAIVGPTASGKTALATGLARNIGDCELVSVDAMAVYRFLDIGTAKPTADEREGLRWHLIDVVDPEEEFSVADFQHLARSALSEIEGREHRAILVGGTGLYHRAIIDQLEIPGRFPAVVQALEARIALEGPEGLHRELAELDPLAASRIELNNARRTLRALEVTLGSGRPFSSFGPGLDVYGPCPFVLIGLQFDRPELDARIEARIDDQLAHGFLEEVRTLLDRPRGLSRTARQALGYRELVAHLEQGISFDATRDEILRRTKSFARRQIAWFRRDPRIVWVDGARDDLELWVESFVRRSDIDDPAKMGQ